MGDATEIEWVSLRSMEAFGGFIPLQARIQNGEAFSWKKSVQLLLLCVVEVDEKFHEFLPGERDTRTAGGQQLAITRPWLGASSIRAFAVFPVHFARHNYVEAIHIPKSVSAASGRPV